MSFQSMSWAVSQKCGSAAAKMVLMMLANHTNGHTNRCNPRHKTLAEECEMRVETLKNHLKHLDEIGLISIIPQFSDGVQLANHYALNVEGGGGENRMGGGGENRPPVKQEVKQESNHLSATLRAALFDRFWSAYPKKVGRDAAEKAFDKRKPDDGLLAAMLSSLAVQVDSPQWTRDGGQFVPNPATWLNQGRWKDGEGESVSAMPDWMRGAI